MYSSVSGLNASGTAISVIGDNIANVNTPGFKGRRPEFVDVLGRSITGSGGFSQVGAGTGLSSVRSLFAQGTFETTSRPTDLAIEGGGFFVMEGQQGRFYTRAGLFGFDEQGILVNNTGQRVQGFAVDPVTGLSTGALGDIQLSTAASPPRATTTLDLSVNLNSGELPSAPFDPSNPAGFNTQITVYDSLGADHSVSFYFNKSGPNAWDWTATVPVADTTTPPASPTDRLVVMGSGTLTFDGGGNLTAAAGSPVTFDFTGGANPGQSIAVNFGPIAGVGTGDATSQYEGRNSTNSFEQDGFGSGQLQNITIDRDGFITGQFSNGETIPLSQVALANFANVEGLVSVGNNNLLESRASGAALVGQPRSGNLGAVRSSNLEQSTVDLAAEFVRLIINQRAFQANTRTVSTTNELMGNLVALGQ